MMDLKQRARGVACAALAALLAAGAAFAASETAVKAIQATTEIPEEQLLDVGIQVLAPGLPQDEEMVLEMEDKGVFQEVRNSEARYIPVHLMDTLQATGQWGAVRVVPTGMSTVDLSVSGTIVRSDGMKLVVDLRATDAAGRRWLEKTYKEAADLRAYLEPGEGEARVRRDPFQALYNRVANDLLAARAKLTGEQLVEVRRIAELRFAADLVPTAFGDYVTTNRKGQAVVARLPAGGDPMIDRIAEIRERDYMFIDTLTEHYATFQVQMTEPYDHWRKFTYEELKAKKELKASARKRKILGALAILGGLLNRADSQEEWAAGQVAVVAGSMALKSGMDKAKEAKMHVEALNELGASFDAEVAPLLVDVEGQTLRLSGSIETQFAEWRQLLREIFLRETGLTVDPDAAAVEASVPES